jgi:hypothetical protein
MFKSIADLAIYNPLHQISLRRWADLVMIRDALPRHAKNC